MKRTVRLPGLALLLGIALGVVGTQIVGAQQEPIKRTDLLKTDLDEIRGNEMQVWVADIAPGAGTGRHSHPTPRFVYVLEGAVVLELDGTPPQTFKGGQAFAELPNLVHNFRNASTTEPARALGFQYAAKGQPLSHKPPESFAITGSKVGSSGRLPIFFPFSSKTDYPDESASVQRYVSSWSKNGSKSATPARAMVIGAT